MRRLSIALVAALALTLAAAAPSLAAPHAPPADAPHVAVQAVDDNDDTRVEVQLVVLAVTAFVVVGIGIGAYLLRKRLGLVAPPPDQNASGHH